MSAKGTRKKCKKGEECVCVPKTRRHVLKVDTIGEVAVIEHIVDGKTKGELKLLPWQLSRLRDLLTDPHGVAIRTYACDITTLPDDNIPL